MHRCEILREFASIPGVRADFELNPCAGKSFFLPGATVATIVMLGALHARRLYDDSKVSLCFFASWSS